MATVLLACCLGPLRLAMPVGFHDEHVWQAIRQGWFNMLQPSCQWGETGRPQSAPPGSIPISYQQFLSAPISCSLREGSLSKGCFGKNTQRGSVYLTTGDR